MLGSDSATPNEVYILRAMEDRLCETKKKFVKDFEYLVIFNL